ncbi:MAG: thioredoxin family protein [Candidatus Heimdallarchaeota archaeon]
MNLKNLFEKGMNFQEFIQKNEENRELFQLNYEKAVLLPEEISKLQEIDVSINILVFGENYCNDTAGNLPILVRISETNDKLILRILARDEYLDIVDKFYLTAGVHRIPICLFLDSEFNEVSRWVERSNEAYRQTIKFRQQSSDNNIFISKLRNLYRSGELTHDTINELLNVLQRTVLIIQYKYT